MRLDLPDLSNGGGTEMPQEMALPPINDLQRAPIAHYRESRHEGLEEERIAGFVIYRLQEGQVEYLLLKKTMQNDWSPPKGHAEDGEDYFEGAERELMEETSFALGDYEALDQYPIYFEYKTRQQVLKRVHLWAARYLNHEKSVRLSPEHDEFQWLDYEAAISVVKRQYKEAIMAADLVIRTYESL